MSRLFLLLALLAFPSAQAFAQGRWYRGNTHVHTNRSDGDSAPEIVSRWYRDHGYHFVVISDHNLRTPVEDLNQRLAAPEQFLVFAGVEVTDRFERRPVHVNGLGVSQSVTPRGGTSVQETITQNGAAVRSVGGVPQINHPNGLLRAALTASEIAGSQRIQLFEVCCADYRGGSGVPSTEELWDLVLTAGKRLYGVAADDAHRFAGETREPGTAWIMVRAPQLSSGAILAALERGDFYATTGVTLQELRVDSSGFHIELPEVDEFGYRTLFIGQGGRILRMDESRRPAYRFSGTERYVRARVERSDGTYAWVQPVFAPFDVRPAEVGRGTAGRASAPRGERQIR